MNRGGVIVKGVFGNRRALVGVLVAGAALSLMACSGQMGLEPSVPRTGALEAPGSSQSRSSASSSLISLIDIKVSRTGLNTIDPCWLVNRGIYNAEQHNGNFTAEFTFAYLSRGGRSAYSRGSASAMGGSSRSARAGRRW